MIDNKKLVPKRRFKGFHDDWEQRKLKDLAEYKASKYSANMFHDEMNKGKYPVFDALDIIAYIDNYDLDVDYISIIKDGAGAGRVEIRPKKSSIIGTMGYIIPKKADINFLYNMLAKMDLGHYVVGSTIPHIYFKDYGEVSFRIANLVEQNKIGYLLNLIDNIITLHQRKLEKLKNLKKAYLSKMFPNEGETIPELRFKGFTDDWEQRKLGEITSYFNGKGFEHSQRDEGKYEIINLNSVSIDGILKPSGKFTDIETETLRKNDLVMILSDLAHGNLLGKVAVIPVNNRFVLNQRVALLRMDVKNNPGYLHHVINAKQEYFKREGAGSSQLNISRKSVENFTFGLPTLVEQDAIASFYTTINRIITLHQRKLEKLQNIKKAYLNEMFV